MAGNTAPAMLELPSRTVQEIFQNGEEVPERYIHRDLEQSDSVLAMDFPVIDLQALLSTSTRRSEELDKLRSALNSWGCFQLINHGVERKCMEDVRDLSKQFFALPLEEKQRYSRDAIVWEGYGDDTVYEDQTTNWNDRLYLKVYPESQRYLKRWPQYPPTFRKTLDEYAMKTRMKLETLIKVMAASLNLDENLFLGQFGDEEEVLIFARFNFYPPCPRSGKTLGFRPHSDGTAITMVLQDKEVEGLQVHKDGRWFQVPSLPDALLVNAGDQLEVMSNGVFKSVLHRVATDSEKERISVAMLFVPAQNAEIGPVDELVDENRPPMYRRVKDYSKVYFQHYPKGQGQIDAMKL